MEFVITFKLNEIYSIKNIPPLVIIQIVRHTTGEREGTSLNCFKVFFFNYIKQFSWSILFYLSLS